MNRKTDFILDLPDLFQYLILKWKWIALAALLTAVLGFGLGTVRSRQNQSAAEAANTGETALDLAKKVLTEAEIKETERVFAEYESYLDSSFKWTARYNTYADLAEKKSVLKRTVYYLNTVLPDISSLFNDTILTKSEIAVLQQILNTSTQSEVFQHLGFSSNSNNAGTLNSISETSSRIPLSHVISFDVVADTNDHCDQAAEIIDSAVKRMADSIQAADGSASLKLAAAQYTSNIDTFVNGNQYSCLTNMQRADSMLTTLKVYFIERLTDSQAAYFKLLVAYNDPEHPGSLLPNIPPAANTAAAAGLSPKKSAAVGFIIGLFLSLVFLYICYLMNGTLKVNRELTSVYDVPLIGSIYVPGRSGIAYLLLNKLKGHAPEDKEVTMNMSAYDICMSVKACADPSLYIINTCRTPAAAAAAQQLADSITQMSDSVRVICGSPCSSPEDLKRLDEAANAILLTELKESRCSTIEKALSMCRRHERNFLGGVTLYSV